LAQVENQDFSVCNRRLQGLVMHSQPQTSAAPGQGKGKVGSYEACTACN
jgi:hypothetical protein